MLLLFLRREIFININIVSYLLKINYYKLLNKTFIYKFIKNSNLPHTLKCKFEDTLYTFLV